MDEYYIDKESILKFYCHKLCGLEPEECPFDYCKAKNEVDNFPYYKVNKVPTGHWVGEYDGYSDGNPVYDIWSCSNCGKYFDEWDEKPDWDFCPNCGADMRGNND